MNLASLLRWPFRAADPTPRPFVSVAAGDAFVCALDDQGRVWCWGANRAGELGGSRTESFVGVPVPVPDLPLIVQVAAARFWAAAVTRDGSVWTWGGGGSGVRTGDPGAPPVGPRPTRVRGLDRVRQLALGERHGCALRDDGSVWCWGGDRYGRLGDGARFVATQPPPAERTPAAGSFTGRLPGRLTGVSADRRDDPAFAPAPVPGLAGVTAVAAFGARTAAIVDGGVRLWGEPAACAEEGRNEPVTAERLAPTPVEGLASIRAVALGPRRHLAVGEDGRVFGFGDLHDVLEAATPVAPGVVRYDGLTEVVEAAASHGAVVRCRDGALRGWGTLRGDGRAAIAPSRLSLRATAVTAGRDFACALDQEGRPWGWGAGGAGQPGVPPGHTIGETTGWIADHPTLMFRPPR